MLGDLFKASGSLFRTDMELCVCHCVFPSRTPVRTYVQGGQIWSAQLEQKIKERGSGVRASRAVWVGKWWKRNSFSKLTAPFRILHLVRHERPESFSTLSYSHQAWRNCHIPTNISKDSVSILVWIHFLPHSHYFFNSIHRRTIKCLNRASYLQATHLLQYEAKF